MNFECGRLVSRMLFDCTKPLFSLVRYNYNLAENSAVGTSSRKKSSTRGLPGTQAYLSKLVTPTAELDMTFTKRVDEAYQRHAKHLHQSRIGQ